MELKNIVLLTLFMLGLVYMQFVRGQSVDDIIRKYTAARGGKEKLNSISSVYMEGYRKMMGSELPVKVTKVQGKLFRNDFVYEGMQGYTIVTPAAGWSFIPMRSTNAEPIAADRLEYLKADLDIAGPLIDYAAKGNHPQLAGKENIEGKEAYKIRLAFPSGKEIMYLLDAENYLVIQTRQMRASLTGNGQEREMVINYGDYRSVDGILFPHIISTPGDGPGAGTTILNNIELNKVIDDSQYRPHDL